MPRGRHRHSPPLHRLLPPSAIAGVSLVCALAPWVFTEPMVLRGVAAAAAATAVGGAFVMRRWDTQAGKRVADLTRARASDEWRHEERVAELETDLEESRELRAKLEQRLRAKRAELAGLRNEHAALLRRYATAETERASALEGRRLLEIEAATPTRALPSGAVAQEAGAVAAPAETSEAAEAVGAAVAEPVAPAVFSPEGSRLFLRAQAALARFDADRDSVDEDDSSVDEDDAPVDEDDTPKADDSSQEDDFAEGDDAPDNDASNEASADSDEEASPKADVGEKTGGEPQPANSSTTPTGSSKPSNSSKPSAKEPVKAAPAAREAGTTAGSETEAAQEDEARGKPEAVDGHERAAATTTAGQALPPAQRPAGHFIAPTAVAVAPATPVRRPAVEGGFDFFGTKTGTESSTIEDVQNEDLADVVGQEALALHKAESEADFKPADEESRGIGQVIDLTAHDETEQIDVQGLRSAVS